MLSMKSNEFSDWLSGEVETRGWSFRELSRRAGVSSSAVSQVVTQTTFPGPSFCNGVARAFGLPPETVFRKAGLLPPLAEDARLYRELTEAVGRLSADGRKDVLEYALMRYRREHE
jgi:transcriptional regulator with XRE-family HTH domain